MMSAYSNSNRVGCSLRPEDRRGGSTYQRRFLPPGPAAVRRPPLACMQRTLNGHSKNGHWRGPIWWFDEAIARPHLQNKYPTTPRASISMLLGLEWEHAAPALLARRHLWHIRRQLHLLAHVTSTWSARAE